MELSPLDLLLVTVDIVCGCHAKSTLTDFPEEEMDMKNESCSHLNLPDFTVMKKLLPLARSSR